MIEKHRFPWVTYMLVVGNLVLAFPGLIDAITVLREPGGNWNQVTRLVAPYLFVLTTLLVMSSIGTVLGYRGAKNIMVALLGVLTGVLIWESAIIMSSILCLRDDIYQIPGSDYWRISLGGRSSIWFAINVWYFLVYHGVRPSAMN